MSSAYAPVPAFEPGASGRKGQARGSRATLLAVLILCAFLPYANTLVNGFAHDDNRQVVANPYIRNFRHLPEIFGTTVWSFMGAQGVTNYYRPMMTLGYLLGYRLFGQLAYGFHLANVLLHIAIVLVLFALSEKLFRDRTLAAVAAGVFALHPVHTESVAWIAAVTDLELTFFYLLTFGLYWEVARPGGARSDRVQLAMAGSFVLTLLSKEQALTLPLVATVYEHFYREDRSETTAGNKLGRYGVLWLLALAYVLFRVRFLGALAPVVQMSTLTRYETLLSGVALVGQYLGKLLWPARLSAFYVFHKSATLWDLRVMAGLAALGVCAGIFCALWRRARLATFGIFWMFATLAPVLNARWMAANVFAERYLYLPSVGFCWLLGLGWVRVSALGRKRASFGRWARVAACVLASLASIRIIGRNRDWQNDVVLFTRTLAASPDAYQFRINLGAAYWERGLVKGAEQEWREALRASPNNAIVLNNLGLVSLRQKRTTEAVERFRQAVRLKPNYVDPHLNLGGAYLDLGLTEAAALQFRAAVLLSPLNPRAHNAWGKFLVKSGRLGEAEEQYRLSVESTPNSEGYDALGDLYLGSARWELAERAFRQALSLDEFDSHAHFNLGALYARAGRNSEAVREYQAGLVTDPANPEALRAVRRLQSEVPHAKP